jgi:hypothetical protein
VITQTDASNPRLAHPLKMRNTCEISLKLGIQGVLPHHPPALDPPGADDMGKGECGMKRVDGQTEDLPACHPQVVCVGRSG